MSVFTFSDLAFMGAVGGVAAFDPDAQAYITAVETADGQALEAGVRTAINDFVIGCKADGIWNAIKASCIMAGARTLAGALVPLVGAAPTSFNFVAGDYNRKTGLVGNAATKYLDANRNNNADPQSSKHISCYATTVSTGNNHSYLGAVFTASGWTWLGRATAGNVQAWINGGRVDIPNTAGFIGCSLTTTAITGRSNQTNVQQSVTGGSTPSNNPLTVFSAGTGNYSNARIAFYSIGESLDLALLDARVTALVNAFAAAIP